MKFNFPSTPMNSSSKVLTVGILLVTGGLSPLAMATEAVIAQTTLAQFSAANSVTQTQNQSSPKSTDPNRIAAEKAEDEASKLTFQNAPISQIIAKWQEALKYWRLAGDRKKESFTLQMIAGQYTQRGEYPKLLDYAKQGLSVAESLNDSSSMRLALSSISLAYQNLGEYEKLLEIRKQNFLTSDDPEMIVLDVLNRANTYSKLGNTQKSFETFNQTLDYWKTKGEPIRQAEILEGLAFNYFKLGEHNKGIEILEQANSLDPERKRNPIVLNISYPLFIGQVCADRLEASKIVLTPQKPESPSNLSNTNYIEENKKLIERYEKSIQKSHAEGKISQEAGFLTATALSQSTLGDSQKALESYQKALKLQQITGQKPLQANTLDSIATILSGQGKKQDAINNLNQSLEIQQELKVPFGQATAYLSIGSLYESLGDYDSGIYSYQQALALFQKIGDRRREADTLLKIGNIYRQQKNYPLALEKFDKALSIAQKSGNCLIEHSANRYMSRTHEDDGDPTKSYYRGEQALTLAKNLSDFQFKPATIANALNLMARAKTKAGDYATALELSRRSLEITRQANLQWANSSVYDVIANAYEASKQYDQAIEVFQEKLALVRSRSEYPEEAYIFYFIAKMKQRKGDLPEALKQIDSAIEVVENIRQDLVSPELRTRFFSTKQDYYELKIKILMELHQQDPTKGYDAQAFDTSERSRARTLLELLNESNANIRQGVDPNLIDQENALKDKLAALEKQWSELISKNPTEQQKAFFQQERKNLLAQYQTLQNEIRAKSPKYAALKYPQPLTLAQVQQQLLDPDTALLQYSLGKDKSYLWVITKDGFHSYTLPSAKDIETAAQEVLTSITQDKDKLDIIAKATTQLSQQILTPATAQLNKKRLLIVPDGILNYIPFSVLPVNNQSLLSKYELINLPSSSSLALIRQDTQNRKPAPKALAILADPIFNANDTRLTTTKPTPVQPTDLNLLALRRTASSVKKGRAVGDNSFFDRLPGTRQEAQSILPLVPENQRIAAFDAQANFSFAHNPQLSQYRIVHFATHGIFNSEAPELSGIILSLVDEKGKPINGFLRLNDIFNLNLPAELVVLSACETGLGKEIKGEGLVGLTRGFMYAGSPRVLVSLWKVDDQATAEIMTRFYKLMLKKKLPPAQALREAQLQMQTETEWKQPYYWSAFVLQGEWR